MRKVVIILSLTARLRRVKTPSCPTIPSTLVNLFVETFATLQSTSLNIGTLTVGIPFAFTFSVNSLKIIIFLGLLMRTKRKRVELVTLVTLSLETVA